MALLAHRIFGVAARSNRRQVLESIVEFFETVMMQMERNPLPDGPKIRSMLDEWATGKMGDRGVCWIPHVGDCFSTWDLPTYVLNVVSDLLLWCSNYHKDSSAGVHRDPLGSTANKYASDMSRKYASLALEVLAKRGVQIELNSDCWE